MKLIKEARIYYSMGWGVYPAHTLTGPSSCSCGNQECPCPGKHPVGRWIEYQNRLPTKSEIELWFESLDCNIGTITGTISGIAVVDIDGEKGLESLKRLPLEDTLTALTGSGGYHMFYRLESPAPTRTGVLPGIDIRADGGYVILAPSIHKSGHRYEWLNALPMAVFDNEVFEKYAPRVQVNPDWHNELLQGVTEGNRSVSAAKLAGRYSAMNLSKEEAWILLSVWNERNVPPLHDSDLKRTLTWAYNKQATSDSKEIVTWRDMINLISKGNA